MELEDAATAQRVVKNSIWLFLSETVSKLLALLLQIVAARYLGNKGFGIFSFAFSAAGILMIFADSGINIFLTRQIAREPDRLHDYLRNAMVLKGGLTLAVMAVLAAIPAVSSFDEETRLTLWAIGMGLLVNGYADLYISAFRAFEEMRSVSLLSMVQRGLFFLFGAAVLLAGYKTVPLAVSFLAVSAVALVLVRWRFGVVFARGRGAVDPERILEIFHKALPIGAVVLFSYIYFRIDTVMLYYLRGEAETGLYSAAFKLTEALLLMFDSVRSALFPLLSKTFGDRDGRFRGIWRESLRYLLILGIPLALGTAVLSGRLAALFYGFDFIKSGEALSVLGLTLPLLALNNLASFILVSANRTGAILKAAATGTAFNIALNFLFIPAWGSLGAAVSTCLTEILVFGLYYKTVVEVCGRAGIPSLLWRPAAAGGGMAAALWALSSLPLLPLAAAGAATYAGLLIALRTFAERDYKVMRGIFNRG